MQTWLPYASFERTARVLDPQRLGKQRVETLQILRAGHWEKYGWKHHPATLMWRPYPEALARYGLVICEEWTRRGHADTVAPQLVAFVGGRVPALEELRARDALPPWLQSRRLHASHRSALVRKKPEWYRELFPDVPDDLPYYWPVDGGRRAAAAGRAR